MVGEADVARGIGEAAQSVEEGVDAAREANQKVLDRSKVCTAVASLAVGCRAAGAFDLDFFSQGANQGPDDCYNYCYFIL